MGLPYSDLSESKLRPVVMLDVQWHDLMILKVTSNLQQDNLIVLRPDWVNKLRTASGIVFSKPNLFHKSLSMKKLWVLTQQQIDLLKSAMVTYFQNL